MGARSLNDSAPLAELTGVRKTYFVGERALEVLKGVSVSIADDDFVAVMGPSGAGKSTLLHVLGALEQPSEGEVRFRGRALGALDDHALSELRNRRIGFVFQAFHLIPRLSVLENVEVPMLYGGSSLADSRSRAREAIDRVGLGHRTEHAPAELSGGERQRVAIARALVNDPELILADEPTGNLDVKTGGEILELLARLHAEGRAIVVVTHNEMVAAFARRRLRLEDGSLVP